MRIVLAEVGYAGVERDVHLRELRRQLVFQLLLAVGFVQMPEVAIGVVSRSILELKVSPVHLDLQVAVPSILERIVAGESQDVIRRSVLLHLGEDGAEVVRIEEGLAAGVRRKRRQRFL